MFKDFEVFYLSAQTIINLENYLLLFKKSYEFWNVFL